MSVLVDTSALYALLDEDDRRYREAAAAWPVLLDAEVLVTHSYVVVECSALVQRRLGAAAAGRLHDGILPAVRLVAVDLDTHRAAVARWRSAGSRGLSLVDATSFVVMEHHRIGTAFAFDADFAAAGFGLWSAST